MPVRRILSVVSSRQSRSLPLVGDWVIANRLFLTVATPLWMLAVFANLFHLSTESMLSDEPVYRDAGWRYTGGLSQPAVKLPDKSWRVPFPDNYEHPPLAKYLFGWAQRFVGHPSIDADRAAAGLCTVLTGVAVCWLLTHYANKWAGLLSGMLITMTPEHGLVPDSFGRYGMLEPVAALFMVCSIALAWMWFRRSVDPRSWALAVLAGVGAGLAASAKESAFLGVVGPILVGLIATIHSRQVLAARVMQTLAAAGSAVVVFVSLYLPLGSPVTLIDYMYDYQTHHDACGHATLVAGHYYRFEPWWANGWFLVHGLGPVLAITMVLLSICAVTLRRDQLSLWLAASLLGPAIFLSVISNVALPFYWTLWSASLFALAALGALEIFERARHGSAHSRRIAFAGTTAAVTVIVVSFGLMVSSVIALKPSGPVMIQRTADRLGLTGKGLLIGVPEIVVRQYTAQQRLEFNMPTSFEDLEFVAAANGIQLSLGDPGLIALLQTNLDDHVLRVVYRDSTLTMYRVVGTMRRPSDELVSRVRAREQATAPELTEHFVGTGC